MPFWTIAVLLEVLRAVIHWHHASGIPLARRMVPKAAHPRVEDFGEVQLEGDDYNSPFVARLHNLGGVEEVFGDAPTLHEARLVPVDEQRDQRLETQAHAFGAELGNAILEGDRAVVLGPDGPLFLGKEDEVGLVDASEVG
jgi:hypothetical protein